MSPARLRRKRPLVVSDGEGFFLLTDPKKFWGSSEPPSEAVEATAPGWQFSPEMMWRPFQKFGDRLRAEERLMTDWRGSPQL